MKKILLRVVMIVAAVLLLSWIFMPFYLRKAIIYQQPGIDDYTIFENRKVNT